MPEWILKACGARFTRLVHLSCRRNPAQDSAKDPKLVMGCRCGAVQYPAYSTDGVGSDGRMFLDRFHELTRLGDSIPNHERRAAEAS